MISSFFLKSKKYGVDKNKTKDMKKNPKKYLKKKINLNSIEYLLCILL
ncbi:hypothetical protein OAN16_01420 [Pelagibacteraceae bacterium]|nr:hypothetical protein [Pelagibacteraceae bacterium]